MHVCLRWRGSGEAPADPSKHTHTFNTCGQICANYLPNWQSSGQRLSRRHILQPWRCTCVASSPRGRRCVSQGGALARMPRISPTDQLRTSQQTLRQREHLLIRPGRVMSWAPAQSCPTPATNRTWHHAHWHHGTALHMHAHDGVGTAQCWAVMPTSPKPHITPSACQPSSTAHTTSVQSPVHGQAHVNTCKHIHTFTAG